MILLVEDEAITRSAFADALRSEGEEVIEAADGSER
jgi:CheY-like chemotaxis protein